MPSEVLPERVEDESGWSVHERSPSPRPIGVDSVCNRLLSSATQISYVKVGDPEQRVVNVTVTTE